ncbi:MAG: hypothetical protein ACYCSH_00340 [Acidithiobacillus sp.]
MYWMIKRNGKWIGNAGSFEAEKRGEFSHELKLTDADGNTIYNGRCSNPSLSDNPFAPQDWAEGDGCTGTYFRKIGEIVWEGL